MLLHDFLTRAARFHADRPAYPGGSGYRSYGAVAERVQHAASGLRRQGLAQGAHVAVLAENNPFFLEAFFACSMAGLVLVPINIRLSVAEIDFILRDSECRALLFDDACANLAENWPDLLRIRSSHPGSGEDLNWEMLCKPCGAPSPVLEGITEDHTVHICYTGGTTGRSKGVMLSHRNVVTSASNKIILGGFQRDDVWLHAAPMFHQADSWACFTFTALGARHVFLPRFDVDAAVASIERYGVTGFQLVPTMILMMLEVPGVAARDFSSVRRILYGSAPMPLENLRRCRELFGPVFQHIYGLTEAAGTVAATPWPAKQEESTGNRLASCGQPIVGVGMMMLDAQGHPCPTGEIGRILVRGANVMNGYWKRADETLEVLKDGWLDTGDLGYFDADGFVFIADRAKDMIITGGENVYSTEVENALYEHPGVLQAAVVGLPDAKWGEAVTAFVVSRTEADVTEKDLIQHCRTLIAAYKCPKQVVFKDVLPKSGAGKVLKTKLRIV